MKLLACATPRCNHQSHTDYQQHWPKPGHTQISHSMKIKHSRYDCANDKKKSDQAEGRWIQCFTSGRELTISVYFYDNSDCESISSRSNVGIAVQMVPG